MTTTTSPRGAGRFRKVGENLYRYSSNDFYYAVFRVNGKLIWKVIRDWAHLESTIETGGWKPSEPAGRRAALRSAAVPAASSLSFELSLRPEAEDF